MSSFFNYNPILSPMSYLLLFSSDNLYCILIIELSY